MHKNPLHRTRLGYALATASIALIGFAQTSQAAPVIPSAVADLDIWLADAGNRFNGTTWLDASGNGNNATAVGARAAGGTNYPAVNYLAGTNDTQFGTTGVKFSATADDLMKAGGSYSGNTDITVITVYSTPYNGNNNVRPVGIGSQAAAGAAINTIFNLGVDGSLRYNNGFNSGTANPINTLLVRASRLDSGAVKDWIDNGSGMTVNINTSTPSGGSISNPLGAAADALYFGDVQVGFTNVGLISDPVVLGLTHDQFISQIAVYNRALTDQEIADVVEWMRANPSGDTTITPVLSGFTYDPSTGDSEVSLKGEPGTAYVLAEADDLDFSSPDQKPIPLTGATVGTVVGNQFTTDTNGDATVQFNLGTAKAATFVRAETP